MTHWLTALRQQYPFMQPQDVVKLLFQSIAGCGHLLGNEKAVTARIADETTSLSPDEDEPLYELLGGRYARVNLRRAMAEGIPPRWIARLMLLTGGLTQPQLRKHIFDTICDMPEELTGFSPEVMREAARPLLDASWLPGHSVTYHYHYEPAYRVIGRQLAETVLPVLCALVRLPDKPCTMIAIDGMCASGKSTLADALANILDAPVARMDDFFTPHPQKTPERLTQPGGNADVERFCEEFLTPYLTHGHAAYRPYDCHADEFGEPVEVPAARYVIVEGTYCLHPQTGRPYDLQVFVPVGTDVQYRRILERDGHDMLQRFVSTWIPLERAYFDAFSLPDERCLVLNHRQL